MKNTRKTLLDDTEACSSDELDCVFNIEEEESPEWEKEAYIKHIRQNLSKYHTYCSAERMADAIGGEFTSDFVLDLCRDSDLPVVNFTRNDKSYVAIAPFLEKLKDGLSFENS